MALKTFHHQARLSLFTFAAVMVLMAVASASANANDLGSDDYIGYDVIVDELQNQNSKNNSSSSARTTTRWKNLGTSGQDPFENVWIHAGVGFAQTTQNLELPNGVGAYMAGRGVQAAVGIDILGPSLSAEGAVRSFGESEDSSNRISLKEFDLKILYKMRSSSLGFRAGGGLSARYMTVKTPLQTFDITTPASVISIGGDIYLTPYMSLGLELGTRNAMISETFDKTSYDGTVRLDTHF